MLRAPIPVKFHLDRSDSESLGISRARVSSNFQLATHEPSMIYRISSPTSVRARESRGISDSDPAGRSRARARALFTRGCEKILQTTEKHASPRADRAVAVVGALIM